jgi:ribosomal protein S18 acetylase RimI-like enzyme
MKADGRSTRLGSRWPFSCETTRRLSPGSRVKPIAGGVKHPWVSEGLRGRGVGRELMAQAEALAHERDCHSAWLDTFSFQAPGFYEKLGYQEFGRLDYPPDHHRCFIRKRLTPPE